MIDGQVVEIDPVGQEMRDFIKSPDSKIMAAIGRFSLADDFVELYKLWEYVADEILKPKGGNGEFGISNAKIKSFTGSCQYQRHEYPNEIKKKMSVSEAKDFMKAVIRKLISAHVSSNTPC